MSKKSEIDYDLLRREVRDAAREAFTEVRRQHSNEHFYVYALYSDESAMTLCPAANTEEALARHVVESGLTDPADKQYLRWSAGEWEYEGEGADHFTAICQRLAGAQFSQDEEFDQHRERVFQAAIHALADLGSEGFFGAPAEREAVTVFFTVTDADGALEIENESAAALNPASVCARFHARYDSPS